ncbi:hypothetical protein C8R45DRAFT_946364 [Mycena sanguinolenta]|nr:hypothetical protein C8R45DRAFT_946364 [Mycena sanguinolenta]
MLRHSNEITNTWFTALMGSTLVQALVPCHELLSTMESGTPPGPQRSGHAVAQAKYRLKNQDSEKEKARLRMRKLREQRKLEKCTDPRNERGETYAQFMDRERREYRSQPDFQDFREYLNKVQAVQLRVDFNDPIDVAAFEELLSRNPCVEDLGTYDDNFVQWLYRRRHNYADLDEWKEELLDYRDIIAEYTPEELDRMQLKARAAQKNRLVILARGGF